MYTNQSCGEHAVYFRYDWNDTPCSSQNHDPGPWYFTIKLHYINFFVYIKIVCKLTVYLTRWSLELQTSVASSVMLHDKHHSHSVWLTRKWMTNLKRKGCLYTCTWKHIAFCLVLWTENLNALPFLGCIHSWFMSLNIAGTK